MPFAIAEFQWYYQSSKIDSDIVPVQSTANMPRSPFYWRTKARQVVQKCSSTEFQCFAGEWKVSTRGEAGVVYIDLLLFQSKLYWQHLSGRALSVVCQFKLYVQNVHVQKQQPFIFAAGVYNCCCLHGKMPLSAYLRYWLWNYSEDPLEGTDHKWYSRVNETVFKAPKTHTSVSYKGKFNLTGTLDTQNWRPIIESCIFALPSGIKGVR